MANPLRWPLYMDALYIFTNQETASPSWSFLLLQGYSPSSSHRQMATTGNHMDHTSFSSRPALASTSASATRGPTVLMTCDSAGLYREGVPWYSQDSTSDTRTSDDDYEYDVHPRADISANGTIKVEAERDCNAIADGPFPGIPQVLN